MQVEWGWERPWSQGEMYTPEMGYVREVEKLQEMEVRQPDWRYHAWGGYGGGY